MFSQQLLCHQSRASPQHRDLDPRRRQRHNLHPPTHSSLVVRISSFLFLSKHPRLTRPKHSEIELAACILCANAPCLRPFFTTHLPFLSLSTRLSASSADKTNPNGGGNNNFPTTIGGKRSRAISPYPYDDTEGIFDGTQDIELDAYYIEMQKGSVPATPNTPAYHAKKHSFAKHGYKPSTGNVTIVSVSLQKTRSRSTSRRSSFSSASEEGAFGKSVSRQQSLRSIGEERRGRRKSIGQERRPRRGTVGQRRWGDGDEGGIVVQTTYAVQSAKEGV